MKDKTTIYHPSGRNRVVVTKELPGKRWLDILKQADCRVEICTLKDILRNEEIKLLIGDHCDGAIGQLTETWDAELLSSLRAAGGRVYSNYAVGYNNVDIDAATKEGIPVGNTPGVLTEATAELAVALTFAAARRVVESDAFMRKGLFHGWLPSLFLGELLRRKTVGIIGAGRIGTAYARMMAEGHKMHVIYYDLNRNTLLEDYIAGYNAFLKAQGEEPVLCRLAENVEQVLHEADVVSLHTALYEGTRHMINRERLALMKNNAVLVNSSRGPLIDEKALVTHCTSHKSFRVGLDVFEDEPRVSPGLRDLDNVVMVPHIGSATVWTREGMAVLAACNITGILQGYPLWTDHDISSFLGNQPPHATPSIVNAQKLGLLRDQ